MSTGVFAAALVALAVCGWAGVWAWVPLARKWRLVDVPNERSSHSTPTLRAGGVPMVALTLATIFVSSLAGLTDPRGATVVILASACIAVTGFIDDLRSLGWRVRFAIQIAMALAVLGAFGAIERVGPLSLSLLAIPLTVLWVGGLTNAYNFMDGIDGIAGTQAAVAGMGWTILGLLLGDPLLAIPAIAITGTAIGFLVHNWPPARIFMGDVSSGFLGFMFATLTIKAAASPEAVVAGVLFVWPFVLDTAVTFFFRLLRRENVFTAHRSHIYQRMVMAGASHARVSALYGGFAVMCTIAGIAYARGWRGAAPAAVIAFAGTAASLLMIVKIAEKRRAMSV